MFGWTQCSPRLNRLTDSNACPAIGRQHLAGTKAGILPQLVERRMRVIRTNLMAANQICAPIGGAIIPPSTPRRHAQWYIGYIGTSAEKQNINEDSLSKEAY